MTPWMDWMHKHIGEHELSGLSHNNPFIVSLFKHTTYKTNNDETPWCAATVCTALEVSGYKSSHSAAAISYKSYGIVCELQPGCIVVIEHPNGSHHVTFCEKIISNTPGKIIVDCLGGNQVNALKISRYNLSGHGHDKIVATRWPEKM